MSADGSNAPDYAAELEAIKLKRQALKEARDARALPSPAEQLATEQRALADDEVIDRLEQEHGRIGKAIAVVQSDVGAVVVRRPHMATFRKFQDEEASTKSLEQLTRPCVLHPTKPEFDRMCEELPFLLQKCADAVCILAGVRADEQRAKR